MCKGRLTVIVSSWTKSTVENLAKQCSKKFSGKSEVRVIMLGKEWQEFVSIRSNMYVMELKDVKGWKTLLRQLGVNIICGTQGKLAYVANNWWNHNPVLWGCADIGIEDEATQILHTSALTTPRYFTARSIRACAADPRQLAAYQQSAREIPTLMINMMKNHRVFFLNKQHRQWDTSERRRRRHVSTPP